MQKNGALFEELALDARPFLKWAGGKRQLLPALLDRLPEKIKRTGVIDLYVEPFVGSGALFFHLKSSFIVRESYIMDFNKELIVAYRAVRQEPDSLLKRLQRIQRVYLAKSEEKRRAHYYAMRKRYNRQMKEFDYEHFGESWVERASLLIFLNKTCYNGLFRLNRRGEFNVPFGQYKSPAIYDPERIHQASAALKDTEILQGDFEASESIIKRGALVYLDPPYRPISKTSGFTDYSQAGFTDDDQRRLSEYYRRMDKKGAYLILSNSDPKNENPKDDFFEDLYRGYRIERVDASRSINSVGARRGLIKELIITNYDVPSRRRTRR